MLNKYDEEHGESYRINYFLLADVVEGDGKPAKSFWYDGESPNPNVIAKCAKTLGYDIFEIITTKETVSRYSIEEEKTI